MANIRPYQISNQLNKAENYAFSFATNEKRYNRFSEIRQQIIEKKLGGKISPVWILMSTVGFAAAIGFGIYAMFNAELALAGVIDPTGKGVLPKFVLSIIGASISTIGLLLGHAIYESFENTERDSNTGNIRVSGWLWVLIPGSLFYIGFQYMLVHTAGSGIEATDRGLLNLSYVVAGIAILELLIGAFILNKAIAYLSLLAVTLCLLLFMYRMNRSAKLATKTYRLYLSFLEEYNKNNSNQLEGEANNNIIRAVNYYSPRREQQGDKGNGQDDNKDGVIPINESQPIPVVPNNGNGAAKNINTRNNHHEDLESFIDDTINDDLTM